MSFIVSILSIFGFGFLFLLSLIVLIILAIMRKRIKTVGIITGVLFLILIISIVVAFLTGPSFEVDNENQTMTFEFMDITYEFDLTEDIQTQVDEFLLEYENSLNEQIEESDDESSRETEE